jgi:hypothetical protein
MISSSHFKRPSDRWQDDRTFKFPSCNRLFHFKWDCPLSLCPPADQSHHSSTIHWSLCFEVIPHQNSDTDLMSEKRGEITIGTAFRWGMTSKQRYQWIGDEEWNRIAGGESNCEEQRGRKEVRLSREEGNGLEKAREWLTFMESSVVNVSRRKPHEMITSAHKSTPRESQNRRGLSSTERRKISEIFRVYSIQIERALKLKPTWSSLSGSSEHSVFLRIAVYWCQQLGTTIEFFDRPLNSKSCLHDYFVAFWQYLFFWRWSFNGGGLFFNLQVLSQLFVRVSLRVGQRGSECVFHLGRFWSFARREFILNCDKGHWWLLRMRKIGCWRAWSWRGCLVHYP